MSSVLRRQRGGEEQEPLLSAAEKLLQPEEQFAFLGCLDLRGVLVGAKASGGHEDRKEKQIVKFLFCSVQVLLRTHSDFIIIFKGLHSAPLSFLGYSQCPALHRPFSF